MVTVLEAMSQFLNWWIGLVIILLLFYLFKFLFMFGTEESATSKLEAAAQRVRNAKRVGRQLHRELSRLYRIDRGNFPKILQQVEKRIHAKDITKIGATLEAGKKELERKAELSVYVDYLTEQLENVTNATRRTAIATDLQALKNRALLLFDQLEANYTDLVKALMKRDWHRAKRHLDDSQDTLIQLAKDITGLEAIERRVTA